MAGFNWFQAPARYPRGSYVFLLLTRMTRSLYMRTLENTVHAHARTSHTRAFMQFTRMVQSLFTRMRVSNTHAHACISPTRAYVLYTNMMQALFTRRCINNIHAHASIDTIFSRATTYDVIS